MDVNFRSALIPGLTPSGYGQHPFHRDAEAWSETNCYVDLWIEVLHSLGMDPYAMLPFSLAADFEGDQWTFLKPSLDDLWSLYGIDVQELNIWDSLADHIAVQVGRGCLPLVEVDAFHLPDTQGTSYQTEHSKTTIGINEINFAAECLGYFHNSGYYELNGTDFAQVLRIGEAADSVFLAPYAEFARLRARATLPSQRLRAVSLAAARRHLARGPRENPLTKYRAQFATDLEQVLTRPAGYYHKYAFATLRQLGTSFLLSALYLKWLEDDEDNGLGDAAEALYRLSEAAKMLLFKMARAVNIKKPMPYEAIMDTMEADWQLAFDSLSLRLGSS